MTTTDTPEIVAVEPCPWCGKLPEICPDTTYGSALVFCPDENNCPVTAIADADFSAGETVEDAVRKWDTRATQKPVDVERARVYELAASINDSDALMEIYAAPEWDCLGEDGKAWVAGIVGETLRRERSSALAYFGASDHASYAFPGADQQLLRDAFCQGAALQPTQGNERDAWRPMDGTQKHGRRLVLCWDDCDSLPAHWETGYFHHAKGWCNTYGHPFSGEPTHFMEPPLHAAIARGDHLAQESGS